VTLSDPARLALESAVAAGAKDCAAKLGTATGREWGVDGVALSLEEPGALADLHASVAGDHYGAHLTFPGGSFLVLCGGKDGYLIASAFARDVHERVESLPKREAHALGEVANIMLNPLLERLAKARGAGLIISGPRTGLASRRDHLSKALARYRDGAELAATFLVKLASRSLPGGCLLLVFLDRDFIEKISPGA